MERKWARRGEEGGRFKEVDMRALPGGTHPLYSTLMFFSRNYIHNYIHIHGCGSTTKYCSLVFVSFGFFL